MMETLRIEFERCPDCGCWVFESNLEDLKDVPPSVIRHALRRELEEWEAVHREQVFLCEHRN